MNYNKLKFDMDRSKISLRELCRRINMSYAGLYRSIKDQTMNINSFEKICIELRLNPNDYFELDHELPEDPETLYLKLQTLEDLVKEIKQTVENKLDKEPLQNKKKSID